MFPLLSPQRVRPICTALRTSLALLAVLAASAPALSATTPELRAPLPSEPGYDAEAGGRFALQLSGISHHFEASPRTGHAWNELNTGLGLQYRAAAPWLGRRWSLLVGGGTLKDSFGVHGGYAAAVPQFRLLTAGGVSARLGLGMQLSRRGMYYADTDAVRTETVLHPVPVLSVEHAPSGLGVNIVAAPGVSIGKTSTQPFVFAQLTKAF